MNTESQENKSPLIDKINSPSDLRKLAPSQLPEVCRELREIIISGLSKNPGHFASSMGAVEIIVALHYVFNTPDDRIVWDVGHQAYAHKLLTGRKEKFATQRTKGGLSGFPFPAESEYDTFVAGHAGNSISAALGMAIADANTPGSEDRKTVAVIGDASISNGLAFEGLNNVSNNPNNLLIILNDNDMSISDNVGALHRYLSDLTTSAGYNKWRNNIYKAMKKMGLISDNRKWRLLRFNNSLKAFISQHQNIFEGLNIRYFGPFDGHDVEKVVKVLNEIKSMSGPRLLHLRTTKGKGFTTAEQDPTSWHAPGKFDPQTGERIINKSADAPLLWQEVFGKTLVELADKNDKVMAVTAAMAPGTSVNLMLKKYPNRTFDVGISEGHAVTFAGGLAAAGKRPFVAIYSSFLQRAYDNIIHDVAIQGLPVIFCIDRAGLVGEDGVTHHGLFDIPALRCIPGLKIASPMDESELRNIMYTSLSLDGPLAIRYPRGKAISKDWESPFARIEIGKGRGIITEGDAEIAVLTLGPVGNDAKLSIEKLKEKGINAHLYDMIWVKPLDTKLLNNIADSYKGIITVEDGSIEGGFGSGINEYLVQQNKNLMIRNLGVPDTWQNHASTAQLREACGFDVEGIVKAVQSLNEDLNT